MSVRALEGSIIFVTELLSDQNVVLALIDSHTKYVKIFEKVLTVSIFVTPSSMWKNSFVYFYEWNVGTYIDSITLTIVSVVKWTLSIKQYNGQAGVFPQSYYAIRYGLATVIIKIDINDERIHKYELFNAFMLVFYMTKRCMKLSKALFVLHSFNYNHHKNDDFSVKPLWRHFVENFKNSSKMIRSWDINSTSFKWIK